MARDINRIEPFMKELTKLWKEQCPDWRFGQLISNVFCMLRKDCFYVEDDEMLEAFKTYFHQEDKISYEEAKKNLSEIIKLSEKEIKNNDENISAILDLADLKSLKIILDSIESEK